MVYVTHSSPVEGLAGFEVWSWYDRSVRSWTTIAVDQRHDQLGDAQYCATKSGLPWAKAAAEAIAREFAGTQK